MIASLFDFFHKYRYHFLVWSLFIIYDMIIYNVYSGKHSTLIDSVFSYSINISLFYFHANVLLKYTLNTQNKLLKYSLVLLVLLEIVIYVLIRFCGLKFFIYAHIETIEIKTSNRLFVIGKIWKAVYYIGNSTGYYFLMHDLQQRLQVKRLKQQELKKIIWEKEIKNELILTQNAFLRAQINPHFLINTLSYLYNETRKLAPGAAESILSLSDIMQYALSKEASSGYIKLEDEINLINSFLVLHQARQRKQTQVKVSYDKESLPVLFIPLVLMTLTENIIKHGLLDDPLKSAEINITYKDSALCIRTSNHGFIANQIYGQSTSLKNISNRLALAYGERAVFNSNLDSQNYFHTYTRVQF